jgi:hypothetical protein
VHPFLSLDLNQTDLRIEAYTDGLKKRLDKQFDVKSCEQLMKKNRYMLNTHSQAITELLKEILTRESELLPQSRMSFAEKRQERGSSESTMATD